MENCEGSLAKYSNSLKHFNPEEEHELVMRGMDSLNEMDADFYFRKGEEHRVKYELWMAVSYYRKALEIDPEHRDALLNKGFCLLRYSDRKTGITLKDDIELSDEERYGEAEKTYEKLINIIKVIDENDADLYLHYYNYGIALYGQDKLNGAMDSFYQSLKLYDNYTPSYEMLALVKLRMGLKEEALRECEKALDISPDNARYVETYGLIKERMGLTEEAIENYRRAIELNPYYVYTNLNLGWLLYREGRYQEAGEVMEDAIKLNPDYPKYYYQLGFILKEIYMEDEAVENFEIFLNLVDENSERMQGLIKTAKEKIKKLQDKS